jgi:hypothetical protein
VTLSTEQGFAFYLAMSTIMRRWALTTRGQGEAGLAVLQKGWEVMERTGEHTYRAEMCRLKGALLLQQQGQVQAEAEA